MTFRDTQKSLADGELVFTPYTTARKVWLGNSVSEGPNPGWWHLCISEGAQWRQRMGHAK